MLLFVRFRRRQIRGRNGTLQPARNRQMASDITRSSAIETEVIDARTAVSAGRGAIEAETINTINPRRRQSFLKGS